MKLGVMSDSHDNIPNVERAVALFNEIGVDLVVHAGDFIAPFAVAPLAHLNCRVVGVFGNNDGERVVLAQRFEAIGEVHPNLASVSLGGRNIAVMHYPELAIPIAKSGDYDVVVYGHTHEIDLQRVSARTNDETNRWYPGAKLEEFRLKADLKRVDVTVALGMNKASSAAVRDWENGLKVPGKHRASLLNLYREHGVKIDEYDEYVEKEKSFLLNPGETGGWTTGKATVAVVDLETLEATIHEL